MQYDFDLEKVFPHKEIEQEGAYSMPIICGVDGCRAGWFVVSKNLESEEISGRVYPAFAEILAQDPVPQVIAVDIPIGLPDSGGRQCDQEARTLLKTRRSSVFPAPIRKILNASTCEEARRLLKGEERSISCQSFGIIRKIREVDEILRNNPALQEKVREVHPEVCFYYMNGGKPMAFWKKKPEGRRERRRLLDTLFGEAINDALKMCIRRSCQEDDVLDAFAALWTAERIASDTSVQLPSHPPDDRFGLRMEIVA